MNNSLTVKNIRTHNRINVLKKIIDNDGITRNELAKLSNVSLMTITNVVDDIMNAGYIHEVKSTSSIGRTPTNLFINESIGVFVCIDLTSTKSIGYILYNIKKTIILRDSIVYDRSLSYEDNIIILLIKIRREITSRELNIIGVGVAVPGPYIEEDDTIKTSLIMEQASINLMSILREYIACANYTIAHDVNMAAKAEFAATTNESSLFYIYLGEGVGGTFINSGEIIKGHDLLAGDIGQVILSHNGCEKTIEEITSIPAIIKHLSDIGYTLDNALNKYKDNDSTAVNAINPILNVIARSVYNVTWLYNPEYIVISSSNKQLAEIVIEYCKKYIADKKKYAPYNLINSKVRSSYYEDNPALIGVLGETINNYINLSAEGIKEHN